jgi:hypothetical protein
VCKSINLEKISVDNYDGLMQLCSVFYVLRQLGVLTEWHTDYAWHEMYILMGWA